MALRTNRRRIRRYCGSSHSPLASKPPRSRLYPTGCSPRRLARSGFRKMHLDPATHTVRFDTQACNSTSAASPKATPPTKQSPSLSNLGIKAHSSPPAEISPSAMRRPAKKAGRSALTRSTALLLSNAAVSTSGSTEQNFEVNGVRYSHILDPKTGLGLTTNITTTVIAPHGIDADGMATAINVLGPIAASPSSKSNQAFPPSSPPAANVLRI